MEAYVSYPSENVVTSTVVSYPGPVFNSALALNQWEKATCLVRFRQSHKFHSH